jgi:pimeloyl-ACP methyl ester carboxylesterase
MKKIKNIRLKGKHGKDILADAFFTENGLKKDVVLFCHGYKGYKDWGAWDLVAEKFARNNFFFVKMNFSHNGGTPEQPIDFPDLEAFGNNNFIIELDDLETVIDWLTSAEIAPKEMNSEKLSLIGHSRGGGIVLLKAAEDHRVDRVATWAGVSDFASRFPSGEVLEEWKKNGVAYVHNGRTKQEMPHYFQFFTTFKENEARLNIKNAVSNLNIPFLIVHGDQDETVPAEEANNLHSWNKNSELLVIPGANHTFGSAQPWKSQSLPEHLDAAAEKTIDFFS